jgi:hypothetical protein
MELKPSKIRYSQDSIARTFGKSTRHPSRLIGETRDDILTGQCNVNSIPAISVVFMRGHWFTSDNRRLWVFQKAEERGKCDKILVYEGYDIDDNKFTTTNEGRYVSVRGDPGGYLWKRYPKVSRSAEYSHGVLSSSRSPSYINRPLSTSSVHIEPSVRSTRTYEAYPAYRDRPASYTPRYSSSDWPQQDFSSSQRSPESTRSSFWDSCIILWTDVTQFWVVENGCFYYNYFIYCNLLKINYLFYNFSVFIDVWYVCDSMD